MSTPVPDIEKLTGKYLRARPDLSGTRFVGKTPDATTTSWVRVTMLDASQAARPTDHLTDFLVQLDCYASESGGQPEANTLARTVRAALVAMPLATHDDAVVTSVRFTGMARVPDSAFDVTRERVILTVSIHAHPTTVVA